LKYALAAGGLRYFAAAGTSQSKKLLVEKSARLSAAEAQDSSDSNRRNTATYG